MRVAESADVMEVGLTPTRSAPHWLLTVHEGGELALTIHESKRPCQVTVLPGLTRVPNPDPVIREI